MCEKYPWKHKLKIWVEHELFQYTTNRCNYVALSTSIIYNRNTVLSQFVLRGISKWHRKTNFKIKVILWPTTKDFADLSVSIKLYSPIECVSLPKASNLYAKVLNLHTPIEDVSGKSLNAVNINTDTLATSRYLTTFHPSNALKALSKSWKHPSVLKFYDIQ